MSDEIDTKATDDAAMLRELLATLPIYAARIGIRSNSTDEDFEFMRFLFKIHEEWLEWDERHEVTS